MKKPSTKKKLLAQEPKKTKTTVVAKKLPVKKPSAKKRGSRAVRVRKQVSEVRIEEPVLMELVTAQDLPALPRAENRFFFLARKAAPVVNKIILVSSISAYVLAFVIAGFGVFAAATPDPGSIAPTAGGILSEQLIEAGKESSLGRGETGATVNPGVIIGKFIANFFFGIAGAAFTVLIFYAGFTWLIAAGDEDKVKKARGIIFHAIIGLTVSLAALSLSAGWLKIVTDAVTPK